MVNMPARVLVVDDSPIIRGLLEQVLLKYGYTVKTAHNGQQAVESFQDYHPDLILMDADMPVLDGVTACTRIREFPEAKHVPIVMVTAFVERQWVDRAYAAGATDYITKPVNLDVLRNRIHYILQAKQAEEALFDEKEKAQITLASICDGVITTDAQGRVEFLNPIATKLTGWTTEEARGLTLTQVFATIAAHSQQLMEFPLDKCLKDGQPIAFTDDLLLIHRHTRQAFAIQDSAAPIRDRNGKIIGTVLVFHDVTETYNMTRELSYKAKHDALTGLYNLHEFKAQLNLVSSEPPTPQLEHILMYMDLDQFKIVNDTCGHEAGDQLLKDVAVLLQKTISAYDTCDKAILARLGGDEFGLLLANCTMAQALSIANTLCKVIEKLRFFWKNGKPGKVFTIGISIGLVPISSTQHLNQKSILAMADAACYAAKNAGRNGVQIYQESSMLPIDQNIQWVSLINDNLEKDNGFSLYCQPIVPLLSNSAPANCYEVLLRMKDERGNLIPPGAFLSVATRYNLISSLDLWVIRRLLRWFSEQPTELEHLNLCSINISGHSLGDQNFLLAVRKTIEESKVPARKLCFDISETAAINNFSGILTLINTLKPLGCRFALDNFGAGIASFTYLKNLPIDFLKIDGALIKDITNDIIDHATVKAINDLAHLMHVPTIAQAVESEEIYLKLKEMEVDYVQGYWLSKPKPLID